MLKKNRWVPYKRKAKSIELNVKDYNEQTIDFFKIYKERDRDMRRILKKIKENYDFDFWASKKIVKKDLE